MNQDIEEVRKAVRESIEEMNAQAQERRKWNIKPSNVTLTHLYWLGRCLELLNELESLRSSHAFSLKEKKE